MRINALFLASKAEVVRDRLVLDDGVWDSLTAPAWPGTYTVRAVLLLAPGQEDVGQDRSGSATITGPDGAVAGKIGANVHMNKLRDQVPVVLPVKASFPGPGRYTMTVQVGDEQAQVGFDVTGPATV